MKIRPLTKVDIDVKGPACAGSDKGKGVFEDINESVAQFFENLFKKD